MEREYYMPTLTVFTPAYNRADTLPRTYESLKNQTCHDFLWLIVDDGSTDGTRDLVSLWQKQNNDFVIRYFYKENGGMHTAHNKAYELIDTELNTCIDSDDMMTEDAVEKILKKWGEVRDQGYAGLVGLDVDYLSGSIIGTPFDEHLFATTLSGFYANGGKGDKKLVYRTDIICQTPEYPVFEGEKYVSLAYKYLLIDQKYQLATLNEALCRVEYRTDGSSLNMIRQYARNPKGFAFWRKCQMQYPESKMRLILACIHYDSSCILAGNKSFIAESPRPFLSFVCLPLGCLLSIYIRIKTKEK